MISIAPDPTPETPVPERLTRESLVSESPSHAHRPASVRREAHHAATRMPEARHDEESTLDGRSYDSLPTPRELRRSLPLSGPGVATVVRARRVIEDIMAGRDPRLLVVTGPCSLHDEKSALEYAGRLAALRAEVGDRLFLVMRAYVEKPRTTVGWKGMLSDPRMDGSLDLGLGLTLSRRLLLRIDEMGVPVATEFLEPSTPSYLSDLVCWTAIGARTTESQIHREMASGLPMPVGFKNGTDGNLETAVNAVRAAAAPHAYPGIDPDGRTSIVRTAGNEWAHLVLRGGSRPNHDEGTVAEARRRLSNVGLRPAVMVDCSHGNSGKDHRRQGGVWREMIRRRADGDRSVFGLMLESHLFEGAQKVETGAVPRYGVSITDACISWTETEHLVRWAHDTLADAREERWD